MITQSPAVMRLPRKAFPLAAAALLLASLPLLAGQEFSRPDDSSDFGRTAPEVDFGSFDSPSAPSEPSMPSVSSEPSAPAEPSAPSEASAPNVPSETGGAAEPSVPSTEELSPPIRLAQERSRPSDSSDAGRTAHEIGSHVSSSSGSSGGSSSSSGSDSGRTARPVGPGDNGPHRQPPSRGSSGDHHGGGHHGGGYYGGGYHGGYYYPYGYYGYGFWPFSSWWWGGWWGYGYPYYPPYGYGYGQPGYYGHGEVGALDFDVSPARTEIYLDGQYVGKVDGFDGWPRYLWLPKGTYDVVLYLDGFKTIARQISVYPGSVISLDDRMEPGDSVRPEDLASKSHERRDERLSYERERRERLERGEPGDDDEEDWQDRVRRERGYRPDDRDEEDEAEEIAEQKGRLRLEVYPQDASVYLDGHFVGTGTELTMMRSGLPVSPGEHLLAVVRPGRKAEERSFEVEAGEEIKLELELESDSR